MLGFEPRTFCMQSRRSTTELHPLPGCLGPHRVVNEDTVIAATHVQIFYKVTCLSLKKCLQEFLWSDTKFKEEEPHCKQNNSSSLLQKLVNTSLNVDQWNYLKIIDLSHSLGAGFSINIYTTT